jgi:hypothetical protein
MLFPILIITLHIFSNGESDIQSTASKRGITDPYDQLAVYHNLRTLYLSRKLHRHAFTALLLQLLDPFVVQQQPCPTRTPSGRGEIAT